MSDKTKLQREIEAFKIIEHGTTKEIFDWVSRDFHAVKHGDAFIQLTHRLKESEIQQATLEAELDAARGEVERLKKKAKELVGACEFVGAMMYRSKSEFYDKIRVIIENPNWPQENGKD